MINVNPDPAEPGYTLPLQTVENQISWLQKKPADLDWICTVCHSLCDVISAVWIR